MDARSDDVVQRVTNVVAQLLSFPATQIPKDANLARDLGVTSLDFIEIQQRLEDVFSIDLAELEFSTTHTIESVVGIVEKALPRPLSSLPKLLPGQEKPGGGGI